MIDGCLNKTLEIPRKPEKRCNFRLLDDVDSDHENEYITMGNKDYKT